MIINPTVEQLKTLRYIIYLIRNKVNNKCYIGQSIRTFWKRYRKGEWWINCSSIYLKNSVCKYGLNNFEIIILEHNIKSNKRLNKLEAFHSKKYNSLSPNGYNMVQCGHQGKRVFKNAKTYRFISPNGELMETNNLTQFCEDYNLHMAGIFKIITKEWPHHKRWTIYDENNPKGFQEKCIKYIVESPTNEIINIYNLAEFCRENNFDEGGFQKMVSGQFPHYKGYTLIQNNRNPDRIAPKMPIIGKTFNFINPNGELIEIHHLRKFCKENNLNHCSMSKVSCGFLKQYKGYRNPNPEIFIDRAKIESKRKRRKYLERKVGRN